MVRPKLRTSAREFVGRRSRLRVAPRNYTRHGAVTDIRYPDRLRCNLAGTHDGARLRHREPVARQSFYKLPVVDGRIHPGKAFDRTVGLGGVPDGYRAITDRQSIKVMVRP
jgi:hypothetical protein